MLLNGVRAGTGAPELARAREVEQSMKVSLRDSVEEISAPANLEKSVGEVFELMLGVRCLEDSEPAVVAEESVTAVVGFGGILSGACVFHTGSADALEIAKRMTGMDFAEIDDTVKDAIGEICNMLAGSWKGRVPQLAANCGLSVPAVITGRNYQLHVQAPEFRLDRRYRFDNARFDVTIICDGLQ